MVESKESEVRTRHRRSTAARPTTRFELLGRPSERRPVPAEAMEAMVAMAAIAAGLKEDA